ncbi:MAG: alpha-galactosidase [Oscillospiraceae bacterium]|jgi:alpha-galactosidase|nr:alpha-galactosidase [Oscillospiraceae bacterium]
MAIFFDAQERIFRLDANESSYAFQIAPQGYVFHLYYGRRVDDLSLGHLLEHGGGASFSPNPADAPELSLDTSLQECPGSGTGDFRAPAIAVQEENGARAVCLKYVSHKIFPGKPPLPGLPATYTNTPEEAETLALTLRDVHLRLTVTLYYSVFARLNVITRWAVAKNEGDQILLLENLQSACVEFPGMELDMLNLHGAWSRERFVERHPLFHGTQSIQSRRGASGHQLNPFALLCAKEATEDFGEAYGFHLIYSGDFRIEAEVSQMHTTRVTLGLNPESFAWQLRPGAEFCTPEAVLSFSGEGFGGVSRTLHRLYRTHLIRGEWKHKPRPILINNWEATYFDFNADKLTAIARQAAKADIDMLVMDDGWFGRREGDQSGLGDWTVNETKLGCTLRELTDRIKAEGLRFGIWFEPEMISPDSDLYRAHPDWCFHIPGRSRTLGRNQLVLNLTLPEVRENLLAQLSAVLGSADIAYVKWDFNRNLSEVFSSHLPAAQSGETAHRYVLGLYELLEALNARFPHILFESCSGGGGRFDPGMLYYMPQTWCSDDTDAVERLKIQYGTSFCYPVPSIGAHVSAVPNHGTRRTTPLTFRGSVAMAGTFGYELDLTQAPAEEIETMREMNRSYRAWQPLIATGDFYRLVSPFEKSEAAWMFVAQDKSEALVQCFKILTTTNSWHRRLRLRGLEPQALYSIGALSLTLRGSTLMNAGLLLPERGHDYEHLELYLKQVRD